MERETVPSWGPLMLAGLSDWGPIGPRALGTFLPLATYCAPGRNRFTSNIRTYNICIYLVQTLETLLYLATVCFNTFIQSDFKRQNNKDTVVNYTTE